MAGVGRALLVVLFWIGVAASAAAQQSLGAVTETVTTRTDRDLNGRDAVREKVVTRRARGKDEERVVIETYLPSLEAGRLALSQRVDRVTTTTDDGSHTVEETTAVSPVASSEPPRVIQRSVTTVRKSGTDTYLIEHEVYESDGNGRLVLVRTETAQSSRR